MTKTLKMSQSFRIQLPEYRRVSLTLVGCGGTGSHIASGLISIAQSLAGRNVSADILFVDPDSVEPKNVGRQLFSQADVGRPKALVLAERINAAFAATTGYAVRKVDALDKFGDDKQRDHLCVVIGAVDNAAARRVIARQVRAAQGRVWWLDAGNERCSGQVALGNVPAGKIETRLGLVSALPMPSAQYPDLLKRKGERLPRPSQKLSCAELVAAGDQGLMVNRMAAAWTLAMLSDFLLGELRYISVSFDAARGNAAAIPLDAATLSLYNK